MTIKAIDDLVALFKEGKISHSELISRSRLINTAHTTSMDLSVGDQYQYKMKNVTITGLRSGKVYFSGSGIGGSASEEYFRSQVQFPIAIAKATLPEVQTHARVVVPKKTLNVSATGSGAAQLTTPPSAPVVSSGAKNATSNATAPAGEPHQDTSLIKLTKKGSTKLYVGLSIAALIVIYFETKIFKKAVK